ncbi:MAG: Stp1/IreP family PP2C-type Ser/Thr phosphatase [Clostridia bacterium]|nr:Stp1/IreP family PP2C-type Ser/Thr phosphatase [Clostridia bacterium]
MVFYGATDTGMVREMNQDNFIVAKVAEDVLFAVVCDGMGGAAGGSVASAIAVDSYSSLIKEEEAKSPAFMGMSEQDFSAMMLNAVDLANRDVLARAEADRDLEGMGTTLVSCIICGTKAYAVNVGDSRLYLIDEKGITQVTKDHSYVQYLVDLGKMSSEEAKTSPNKNIITRAVGTEKGTEGDFYSFSVPSGSKLLLCSDGLSNQVDAGEIFETVRNITDGEEAKDACEKLISLANGRGGPDNITAVILSV